MNCDSWLDPKLLDGRADRFGIDQVIKAPVVRLGLRETLFHRTLNADKACPELVFRQFTGQNGHAVAQMVDIVNITTPIVQIYKNFYNFNDIASETK